VAVKIRDILAALDRIAPFERAEEWDNIGLIVGDRNGETDSAVLALDLSEQVIEEAIRSGAGLIVCHHPILFRGTKKILSDAPDGRLIFSLIRNGIAFIAMHTNYDAAPDGVNAALAERLGLANVQVTPSGMAVGDCPADTFGELCDLADAALLTRCRGYGAEDAPLSRVAVMGGSGADYAGEAKALGADAFLTGEISYHKGLDLAAEGLCAIEAGHYETEKWAMPRLAEKLSAELESSAPHMILSETLQLREMEV